MKGQVVDSEIMKYIKSFNSTIIWGCSFLGIPVGKYLLESGVNVVNYWDIKAGEIKEVHGVKVVKPFVCEDKQNTLIITCIGNNNLRQELTEQLINEQFPNIMSDQSLHELYKIALKGDYSYHGNDNPLKMSKLERIQKAVDYAVETDNKLWYRPYEIIERLRISESICLAGSQDFPELIEKCIFSENGINNVKFFLSTTNEKQGQKLADNLMPISLDRMGEIESPVVVLQEYDKELSIKLAEMKINYYFFGDLILNVFTPYCNGQWFKTQKNLILDAFNLIEDEFSQEIFVELLCNRIAPHLATKTFNQFETPGKYFNHGIFELSNKESLVDAGAYIGDTIDDFMSAVDQKFDKIFAFELTYSTFKTLEHNVSRYDTTKIKLFNQGLYDENKKVCFDGSDHRAHISNDASDTVEVVRLDDALESELVTLIKMDIEGSEMSALRGARKIIATQRPRLAISIYHKLPDLWEVPLYVKNLNSQYKISFRNHGPNVWYGYCYAF